MSGSGGAAAGGRSSSAGYADWRQHPDKHCKDEDPDIFFPPDTRGAKKVSWEETAKAVCVGCPVAAECLLFALDRPLVQGVWGGTTEDERKAMRQEAAA